METAANWRGARGGKYRSVFMASLLKDNCALARHWIGSRKFHSFSVEDEGSGLGLGALGWELFSVEDEVHTGGVAHANHDFVIGADRSVRGSNECLLGNRLPIGGNGDPGSLCSSNHQHQRLGYWRVRRTWGWSSRNFCMRQLRRRSDRAGTRCAR